MRFLLKLPFLGRYSGFGLLFLMMMLTLGCQVGEDDPLLSLRSRNARLKGTWRLMNMDSETKLNLFVQGGVPVESIVSATYDGRDLRVVTTLNDAVQNDTTIGFSFIMELLDRGKLNFTSTVIVQGAGVRSGGEDNWFWLNDDRRKSRVFLGNALQFTQLLGDMAARQPFFTELEVTELRNDLLRLYLRKRVEQTGLDGNFQEIQITGRFEFRPN